LSFDESRLLLEVLHIQIRMFSVRGAAALTILSFFGAALPAPGDAATLRPAFAPVPVGIGASQLEGNVAACSQIRTGDVAAVVATIRAARNANVAPDPIEVRDAKSNPAAFHAWLERNKPRGTPHITIHQMTPVEFATFRAAMVASTGRISISRAINACSAQASAANKASPRSTPCETSSCNNPCPSRTTQHDASNGTYNLLYFNSICSGKPSSTTSYNSNGTTLNNGTTSLVTITGYPGAASSIPGVQSSIPTSSGTVVTTLPGGAYVPQKGWVTLPGATYKGAQLSAYISSTNAFSVSLDANDMVTSSVTAYDGTTNDGVEVAADFSGTTYDSPVVQASIQTDVLTCVGSAGLFAAAMASLLSTPVDGPLGVAGATVIFSEIVALGACGAAFDDFNASSAGGNIAMNDDQDEF
jgi:hypothetical protein